MEGIGRVFQLVLVYAFFDDAVTLLLFSVSTIRIFACSFVPGIDVLVVQAGVIQCLHSLRRILNYLSYILEIFLCICCVQKSVAVLIKTERNQIPVACLRTLFHKMLFVLAMMKEMERIRWVADCLQTDGVASCDLFRCNNQLTTGIIDRRFKINWFEEHVPYTNDSNCVQPVPFFPVFETTNINTTSFVEFNCDNACTILICDGLDCLCIISAQFHHSKRSFVDSVEEAFVRIEIIYLQFSIDCHQ